MAEPIRDDRWLYRAIFVVVAGVLLFLRLLPVGDLPGRVPAPDLLLCVTFAWALRRPEYVPPLLVAGVFLVEDLLTLRPPGLWTLAVVLGTEFLRGRAVLVRDVSFLLEWAIVAVVMAAATVATRVVLAVAFVPQPGAEQGLVLLVLTALAYPFAAFVSRRGLGVRKPATGEVDALGKRL